MDISSYIHVTQFRVPYIGAQAVAEEYIHRLVFRVHPAQVPVNPVCPYTASGAEGAQRLRFTMDTSGNPDPRPRRLMADFSVVNKRQVASLKKRLPLNSPPFSNGTSNLCHLFGRREKSCITGHTPPMQAAVSSCTYPRISPWRRRKSLDAVGMISALVNFVKGRNIVRCNPIGAPRTHGQGTNIGSSVTFSTTCCSSTKPRSL